MKTRITLVGSAVVLALTQPLPAFAQAQKAPTAAAPASTTVRAPATAQTSPGWIEYEDLTFTPVLDEVSTHLAAARAALAKQDNAKAADAMQAAADALEVQAERAAELDRQRAAADLQRAHETQARLMALTKKLDATAEAIKAGKVPTTAALDQTLDNAARADLEQRWLVTDVATWYPVAEEPQRHFLAASDAFARQDFKAAAVEVRKAEAYMRLESARATGDVKTELDTANAELEQTAQALDKGNIKTKQDLDQVFAKANHALALAYRAKAAESWARKAYDDTGYELKAAAQRLESAAAWTGTEAKSATAAAVTDIRAVGDKLASGGVWAKEEIAKGFLALGNALDKLGQFIGSKSKPAPVDVK
jgi:uncharacterized membrane protein